jgi:Rrf2 family protein
MLFSAKAEYACIAMLELAARHGDPQPIRLQTMHAEHGIPKRFLVQIMLQLKGAGLVVSVRGATGGYRLAREPQEINLAQIIGVIDRLEPTSTTRQDDRLQQTPTVQTIRSVWREIQSLQQRILTQTTLAELVRRAQDDQSFAYQI